MFRTALRFIQFDRPKSIGIVVGIVISVFLVGQQLSTVTFIADIMGGLITNSNSESGRIWVIENTSKNVNQITNIDSRLVQEIRSIEGVANTYPILLANVRATLRDGKIVPFVVVGSDPSIFAGGPTSSKIIEGDIADLSTPGAVSVETYNVRSLKTNLQLGSTLEINGKHAKIVLKTKNAQAFGGHYMFTSIKNLRYFSGISPDKVSIITVKVKDGVRAEDVITRINQTFYGVTAWDTQELTSSTSSELLRTTNMGVSFGAMVVFAMITGFFIIGLTLYSSVLDRLKDYGTLKAIGATNGYVRRLILTQAIIYALIGFAIAMFLLVMFKNGAANAGLVVDLSPKLVSFLIAVTLFISIGGSLFAIRKINKLEPASVFK